VIALIDILSLFNNLIVFLLINFFNEEKSEDIEGEIRTRNLKKDRQYNTKTKEKGQKDQQ